MPDRFLTREQVADELNISMAQAYALIRRGELRALKLGGRGTWRVGRDDLEAYIARLYEETEKWIEQHPVTQEEEEDGAEWRAPDLARSDHHRRRQARN